MSVARGVLGAILLFLELELNFLFAGAIPAINERTGYFLSGFLAGGYYLAEYYAPGVFFIPLLPFVVEGVIGSLIMGYLLNGH